MPELDAADSPLVRRSVFLSYASEDRQAARLLRDALPDYGLVVWYDESDIGGGEAWDQKIRRQIRECDYFMPLVSAQTEARREGYFRREWRLAVERTLDMADDHPFLLPVVIDDTDQATARVPEKFLAVQWLKVPGGRPTRALESLCRRIASGDAEDPQPARKSSGGQRRAKAAPLTISEFPHAEPGQRLRFWVDVMAWALRSAWVTFKRLPRWIRWAATVWVAIVVVKACETPSHRDSGKITPAKIEKLGAISQDYQGSVNKNDIAKLGAQIAREFSDDSDDSEEATDRSPLLAVAFSAPAGDEAAGKLADSAFALTYGTVAISHHGQVSLSREPLPTGELGAALERARANHSKYVLYGTVDGIGRAQVLTIKIAKVADGSIVWSRSYPAAGADPAKIAAEVNANLPPLAASAGLGALPRVPSWGLGATAKSTAVVPSRKA